MLQHLHAMDFPDTQIHHSERSSIESSHRPFPVHQLLDVLTSFRLNTHQLNLSPFFDRYISVASYLPFSLTLCSPVSGTCRVGAGSLLASLLGLPALSSPPPHPLVLILSSAPCVRFPYSADVSPGCCGCCDEFAGLGALCLGCDRSP